ncbi:MAG: filamentous hemagglutinin N-terminal domain-containing protein [Okeania sp. SIO3B3]|nr:filamentous hemagglutinin N-terminal domain-containing protein [Okeania sp. SIO3B3]
MTFYQLARQLVCIGLSWLVFFQPGLAAMAASRPTVVDPAAPSGKRPTMHQAGNGVPIQNIATPGKKGVSHNRFKDFNVNKRGLIINNSRSTAKSQLGGFISANPNLKNGEAQLILNEVTGANRSHLEGYTELHGRRADYILANPNGITVNGGGFINFPRVTLATGEPRFGASGLEGLDVRSGDILVEGKGINASNIDAFTLLARTAKINADIHARNLAIVAGQNTYNPFSKAVTPLTPDGSATPAVGIDSSVLGGMYANRIVLQGTEAGVGVNLEGVTQATDAFELTADGRIQLKNKLSAGRALTVHTQDDALIQGTVYSGGSARIDTSGVLEIRSATPGGMTVVGAADRLSITGSGIQIKDTTVAAGLQESGSVAGGGLSVSASNGISVQNSHIASGSRLEVDAANVALGNTDVNAGEEVVLTATHGLSATSSRIGSGGNIQISAREASITQTELAAERKLSIVTQQDLNVHTSQALAKQVLEFTAHNIAVVDGGLRAGQMLSINAGGGLAAVNSSLSSDEALTLNSASLNLNATELAAATSASLTTAGQLSSVNSSIYSGKDLNLTAGTVAFSGGAVETAESLLLSSDGSMNVSGGARLTSLGTLRGNLHSLAVVNSTMESNNLTLVLSGNVLLDGAMLTTMEDFAVQAATFTNDGATLVSMEDMELTLENLKNLGGLIYAGGELDLNLRTLRNTGQGYIVSDGDVSITGKYSRTWADMLYNEQSVIESLNGGMQISAFNIQNISGMPAIVVQDVGWETLDIGFDKKPNPFKSDGSRNVYNKKRGYHRRKSRVTEQISKTGERFGVRVKYPGNRGAMQQWIQVRRDVVTSQGIAGELLSASDMDIKAGTLTNKRGHISSGRDLSITASLLHNQGVELSSHFDIYHNILKIKKGKSKRYANRTYKYSATQVSGAVPAVISAAGALNINASNSISNEGLKAGKQYTGKYSGVVGLAGMEINAPLQTPWVDTPGGDTSIPLPTGIGSLYVVNQDPGHAYFIETNPALTSRGKYFGSQYFFDEVGLNISDLKTRILGDAFFETNMVRKQVLQTTGKRYLDAGYTSDADQMRQLMENAAQAYTELDLQIGAVLSADQLAALDNDIVWYETRQVMGQETLVPVLYLGSASRAQLDTTRGAMLTGAMVNIQTAQLNNSGGIAGQDVTIQAGDVLNQGGDLTGDALQVAATNDIVNRSGSITGGDITLSAGRDVVMETLFEERAVGKYDTDGYSHQAAEVRATGDLKVTSERDVALKATEIAAAGVAEVAAGRDAIVATQTVTRHYAHKGHKSSSTIHMGSDIQAGELHIQAGRDASVVGSNLAANGDLSLRAERDASIVGAINTSSKSKKSKSGNIFSRKSSTLSRKQATVVGSSVSAGGNVVISAGINTGDGQSGSLTVLGSQVAAKGSANLAAEGDIVVAAMEERSSLTKSEKSSNWISKSKSKKISKTKALVGSSIQAGKDVDMTAGGSLALQASTVSAERNVTMEARDGNVIVAGGQNTSFEHKEKSKSGFGLNLSSGALSFYESSKEQEAYTVGTNVASAVSAGQDVSINSSLDTTIVGSAVAAGGNLDIDAGRDLNVIAGRDSSSSNYKKEKTNVGFSWSTSENEVSYNVGSKTVEEGLSLAGEYNVGSLLSAGQDVTLHAERDVNQISSHIEAGRDASLHAGGDITVGSATDTESQDRYVKEITAGIQISASQNLSSAARSLGSLPKAAASGKGSAGNRAITAASEALRGVSTLRSALNPRVTVQAGVGTSYSSLSESTETGTVSQSSIMAGRDVSLDAGQDVTLTGSHVAAMEDVTIKAGQDVTIQSDTGGRSSKFSSFEASAFVGVKASASLPNIVSDGSDAFSGGISGSASVQSESSKYDSTTHTNSNVWAGGKLTVESGRDTTVAGANLEGESVDMDVGRNLTVASRQDTSGGESSSWGASVDVTAGPASSGSGSVNYGEGSSSSAWVREQTAIVGRDEVDVYVGENTHLEGAVLASATGNLTLDTNTLTYADLDDHNTSESTSVGVSSLGASWDTTEGQDGSSAGPDALPGTLDFGRSSSDTRQQTRATLGQGTVVIRSTPGAGLEGLNRDLARAQEIVKDSEQAVTVYIDPEAIKEVAGGFEGIREDFKKLADRSGPACLDRFAALLS